jgi:hypothetical protein
MAVGAGLVLFEVGVGLIVFELRGEWAWTSLNESEGQSSEGVDGLGDSSTLRIMII